MCPVIPLLRSDDQEVYPQEAVFPIRENITRAYIDAARWINDSSLDIVSVQHEWGIFGGINGCFVLDFLNSLKKPAVITLHTLPQYQPLGLQHVARSIANSSDALVVLTNQAKEILSDSYGITDEVTHFIPHGVPTMPFSDAQSVCDAKRKLGLEGRSVITSFGLIRPDKGIEYVIEALTYLKGLHRDIVYLVLGQLHPDLLTLRYRTALQMMALHYGVKEHVLFESRYLPAEDLALYLRASDVYVNAYPNIEQVASGTLAYALGAGKAIVSTPYVYAKDLLRNRGGILVPPRNALAIARAIHSILSDQDTKHRLERESYALAASMRWPAVANAYASLFAETVFGSDRKPPIL